MHGQPHESYGRIIPDCLRYRRVAASDNLRPNRYELASRYVQYNVITK
jgi:hypothetical protein